MLKYRQGDVYLIRCRTPKALAARADNRVAVGEATGHAHHVIDGEVLVGEDGALYVRATKGTTIQHLTHGTTPGDHATIALDPGTYRVVIQRTYEPQGARQVAD